MFYLVLVFTPKCSNSTFGPHIIYWHKIIIFAGEMVRVSTKKMFNWKTVYMHADQLIYKLYGLSVNFLFKLFKVLIEKLFFNFNIFFAFVLALRRFVSSNCSLPVYRCCSFEYWCNSPCIYSVHRLPFSLLTTWLYVCVCMAVRLLYAFRWNANFVVLQNFSAI